MMQSKDLRIGNILNYDTVEEGILPTVIDWQDLKWLTEDPKGFNLVHSPIPLTEEWLLKFGFEEKGTIFRINKNTENEFDVFIKLKTKEIYFGGAFRSYQIKHVNQLQNLYFSLTGEELELKKD